MGRYPKMIHMATLSRIKTIVIPEGVNITGSSRFCNAYAVVDNFNKRLALVNNEGVHLKDIVKFTNNPLDVCFIGGTTVAVTIPSDHMVAFVDINECKIVESVVYSPKCHYIVCYGDDLFIGCPNSSRIIIADIHGREIRSLHIPGQRFDIDDYYNIYITNENEDLVSCYDKYGNQKWIVQDIVRDPIGISVSHDFVTVLSKHNALHILSLNGYEKRVFLNTEHGLDDPSFMYSCSGMMNELIVVCNKSNNKASAYLLSK